MKKIYVAGAISGLPNHRELFLEAVEELEGKGYVVLDPSVFPPGFEQDEYMHICYAMIDVCEGIYFLSNWKDSKGANLEHDYGKEHGKGIWYQGITDIPSLI